VASWQPTTLLQEQFKLKVLCKVQDAKLPHGFLVQKNSADLLERFFILNATVAWQKIHQAEW
jgi:hypothetical protein